MKFIQQKAFRNVLAMDEAQPVPDVSFWLLGSNLLFTNIMAVPETIEACHWRDTIFCS